jgi:hypothetical protein
MMPVRSIPLVPSGWTLHQLSVELLLSALDHGGYLGAPSNSAEGAGSQNCQVGSLLALACLNAPCGLASSYGTNQMHFPSSQACRNLEGFHMLWTYPGFDESRTAGFAVSR